MLVELYLTLYFFFLVMPNIAWKSRKRRIANNLNLNNIDLVNNITQIIMSRYPIMAHFHHFLLVKVQNIQNIKENMNFTARSYLKPNEKPQKTVPPDLYRTGALDRVLPPSQ